MSKRNKTQLSHQVLLKFRVIFGSVRQHFREIEQNCGVTGSQLWVLKEIAKARTIGVGELANRMAIHQSTCSQLVEKLVTQGLIKKERGKEDQRRVSLCLTDDGIKILQIAPRPAEGILPTALNSVSEATLLDLDKALLDVIDQLRIKNDRFADIPLSDL